MSTIAIRQIMVPAFFFVAGLGLLAVSYMPTMQQQRLPAYPSTTMPLSTAPSASLSAPPVVHPRVKKSGTPMAKTPAVPSAKTGPGATAKASAVPTTKPGPGKQKNPAAKASAAPSNVIVRGPNGSITASNNNTILHENPVTIGREDPFKSLLAVPKKSSLPPPPPIPGVALPGQPPAPNLPSVKPSAPPTAPPATPPPLKAGLSLQGLVTGDEEPAAILNVDGNTQLVRVGDVIRRPGYVVTITNINERALSITLSDGKGHNDVLKTE